MTAAGCSGRLPWDVFYVHEPSSLAECGDLLRLDGLVPGAALGVQEAKQFLERLRPEAVGRVRAMVASEQHCCAFLTFDVREQPDVVRVTITAPEHARDAADELFGQFTAADDGNR